MSNEYSSSFYLDCIQKTLSHLHFRDQFPQLKFFSDKKYRLIILYELMKDHYLKKIQDDINTNFILNKEAFYHLVSAHVSRLSMTKFIDRMVETGVLIKRSHTEDKRKQILSPSIQLIEEFEKMHQ